MKINEVIAEAGFWKGVAKAIAPQTVQTYDRQKNALKAPQTAGDPAMANITPTTSAVTPTTTPTSTSVDTTKIQAAPKPGLPTPAEQAKLQQAIQAQLQGQR